MGTKYISPLKAIRLKCLDCCCGSAYEVRLCPCPDCSLYPFRLGENPYRTKREYTSEQREALAARIRGNIPTNTGEKTDDALSEGSNTTGGQKTEKGA